MEDQRAEPQLAETKPGPRPVLPQLDTEVLQRPPVSRASSAALPSSDHLPVPMLTDDIAPTQYALDVKVVALMCDLHELLVGEPKGVLEGGVLSCTKDNLEGTGMKQSRRLDGLQTKSSLRLDFPLEMLFIYRRES